MRQALVQLLGTQITKTWPLLSPQHFWEEGSSREAQDAVETLEGPPPRSLVFKTRAPSLPKPSLGLTHYALIMLGSQASGTHLEFICQVRVLHCPLDTVLGPAFSCVFPTSEQLP